MGKKSKKKRERNNTIKLVADPGLLTRRVESALSRREVDTACQLLSQARQLRKTFSRELDDSERDLCARAYAAQAYARWDKPQQALDALDQAIDLMPECAKFHRLQGNILRRLGRTKSAVTELAEAQRLAPADQSIGLELILTRLANGDGRTDLIDVSSLSGPRSALARALVAAFRGDLPLAEREASTSPDPAGRLTHAVLLLAQGEVAKAISLLAKVVALEPCPGMVKAYALFYLGVARVQRRELAAAVDALEQACVSGVPEDQVRIYLSWVCQQLAIDAVLGEDLPTAARWFERLEKLGGPDAQAAGANAAQVLVLMGQAAAKDGDYEGAVAAWSRALAARPRDTVLRQNLAVSLERAGRTDEAISHWKYLVRQIPREAKKDARQRDDGQGSGDEDDMLKHIRALAHQHLADLYLEQDEVDLAIEQLERALQVLPSDIEIRRSLATTLVDEGLFRRAIPHLERLVAAAPGSADDNVELGLAYLAVGDGQPGVEHLEKALALEPEHPMARLSLGKALAERTLKSPKASNALADAQRAVELLPAPGAFIGLVAYGAAQLARGNLRAAEKTFKEAIKRSPDKPDTQVKVGEAYWSAGERKAAVAMWTQAMKEAKKIPCAYADLVEMWAKAGDGPRCEQCLAASLNHNEDEALNAIENISRVRDLQPFLRTVLHHVAAFTGDPVQQAYLAQGLIYAGDMQGARTLLRSAARRAVEMDDDLALRLVTGLDLKYKYSLLDHGTAEVVQAWIDANLGRLW